MPTKQAIVIDWITSIAVSLKPSMHERELKIVVRNTARNLSVLYPPEAFTLVSGAAIADGLDEFPTGLVIAERLAEWWRYNRAVAPTDASLPGGDDPTLTVENRLQLKVWLQDRAGGFSHIEHLSTFQDRLTQSLSVLRKYSPRMFDYIVRTDVEAQKIAMRRGWLEDASDHRRERTPEEIAHAQAVVRDVLQAIAEKKRVGPMYRKSHTIPDQLDSIDAAREQVARDHAAFEAKHGRAPGAVSRERLEALRAAAGIAPKLAAAPKPFAEPAEAETGGPPPDAWVAFPDDAAATQEPEPPSEDAKPIPGLPWFLLENAA
jgi:hypothetical protein